MLEFHYLFPEIGMDETRNATVLKGDDSLPSGLYLFLESYCTDRGCDCRRVMLHVMQMPVEAEDFDQPGPQTVPKEIAWIAHAFEPPKPGAHVPEQTMLDPLLYQSEWAAGALRIFNDLVIQDPAYRERLVRHYRMVKDAVATKGHPIHARIAAVNARAARLGGDDGSGTNENGALDAAEPKPDPYAPCPCGSGKKYKFCCRLKRYQL